MVEGWTPGVEADTLVGLAMCDDPQVACRAAGVLLEVGILSTLAHAFGVSVAREFLAETRRGGAKCEPWAARDQPPGRF